GPRLAPLRGRVTLERAVLIALRTVGRFPVWRVASTPEPFQAGRIIGELAHELHEGARRLRRASASRLEAVNWGHLALLVGKKASRGATCGAFALSESNTTFAVGRRTSTEKGY